MKVPVPAASPAQAALPRRATRIDIPAERRTPVVALLNARLADAFDLFSQTKQAHWNVRGRSFISLHKLFDELAETLEGHADLLAERATALGGTALGTARAAAAASSIAELPPELSTEGGLVEALAARYAAYGALARRGIDEAEALGDRATADVLTEITRDVDQALYFLESHLEGPL